MSLFERKKYANIEVLEFTPNDPEVTVIFMHGYGADANDLSSLSHALLSEKRVRWIFPEGILKIPFSPTWFGRAWFPIDFAAIERVRQKGEARNLSLSVPQGLEKAREELLLMMSQANIDLSRTVLGGFSQGSMMAVDLTLRLPLDTLGLVILSGTLVNAAETEALAKRFAGFEVFQSHGLQDPVLPYSMAKKLWETLMEAGLKGKFIDFSGGHEIPPNVIKSLDQYLLDVL